VNCHAHLIAMLLGSSESIPIHEGRLMKGTWQSVILAELDGPRERTIGKIKYIRCYFKPYLYTNPHMERSPSVWNMIEFIVKL
jgi:hypothetical protein